MALILTYLYDVYIVRNQEVKDKRCHPELRACCTSVHGLSSEGRGCVDVAVASNGFELPDYDFNEGFNGFVGNVKELGIGLWELVHDKA